jgi:hypothetical protein
VSNAWAVASALHAISTPYSTSVSVPLLRHHRAVWSPRHIVRQFQSPYTPSPRGLSRISARQVTLALASRFSRMLSFQIKDMEFTGLNTIVAIAMLALYDEFDTYWQNGGYKKISDIIFAECHIFIVYNLWSNQEMFAISLSSCSRYNANFKLDQSVSAIHDSPPYFWDQWGWPPTETSLVTHARDHWWTLDFAIANAFVSPGVNSRGGISTLARRFAPSARGKLQNLHGYEML